MSYSSATRLPTTACQKPRWGYCPRSIYPVNKLKIRANWKPLLIPPRSFVASNPRLLAEPRFLPTRYSTSSTTSSKTTRTNGSPKPCSTTVGITQPISPWLARFWPTGAIYRGQKTISKNARAISPNDKSPDSTWSAPTTSRRPLLRPATSVFSM